MCLLLFFLHSSLLCFGAVDAAAAAAAVAVVVVVAFADLHFMNAFTASHFVFYSFSFHVFLSGLPRRFYVSLLYSIFIYLFLHYNAFGGSAV